MAVLSLLPASRAGHAIPTATQNSQARCARDQKEAENCNSCSRQPASRRAVKKGGTTSGRTGPPEVVPLFKGLAHRRRPERPCSASFCVAAAEPPPAYFCVAVGIARSTLPHGASSPCRG